ncbi:MAG: sigma-54 dependent transcriptional regulator [Gammaproteobacteria bacterium]|nr:sigma-54 dependent transcriptional regulator [Gammaproteobacteria bacterium]
MEPSILLVDDDPTRREHIKELLLSRIGKRIIVTDSHEWQAAVASSQELNGIMVGVHDTDRGSMLLEALRSRYSDTPIFYLGGLAGGNRRVTDIHNDDLYAALDLNARLSQISKSAESFQTERSESGSPLELFRSLVGESRALRAVKRAIMQVADSEANVLLTGESGCGKEVVARNIHFHSPRRDRPFVPVNCGAIPAELLESELFGHEKGAFTGAINTRKGRFEMAKGGTLFLDEIGDMPLPMQVKLLRVLQERTFERVGSENTIHADVRIVAATHQDLEERIEVGKFREDLYFRLCVFPIHIPPLRDRIEDLPSLIDSLLNRLQHERNRQISLTARAMTALRSYSWPGNVRELANLIERLAIMYPNTQVDAGDLPDKYKAHCLTDLPDDSETVDGSEVLGVSPTRLPPQGINLRKYLAEVERELIEQALAETDGVVARAAELLHTRRTTLVEKIRKYKLGTQSDRQNIDIGDAANQ